MSRPVPDASSTTPCPDCGHPEDVHVIWSPDEICDGWAHCTVGTVDAGDACQCWRTWPKLVG